MIPIDNISAKTLPAAPRCGLFLFGYFFPRLQNILFAVILKENA